MTFEFLEHTADIKFRANGKSLNGVFESCALALSAYIAKDTVIDNRTHKEIAVRGADIKELLYTFMDELLFLLDAEDFISSHVTVSISGSELRAQLEGDKASEYAGLAHVKAVTYADMYVKQSGKEWEAQVVLDV